MSDYVTPELKKDAFNCPHCGTYAHQKWKKYYIDIYGIHASNMGSTNFGGPSNPKASRTKDDNQDNESKNPGIISASFCDKCNNYTLWVGESMVYPQSSIAPLPAYDMPPEVKDDFFEARNTVNPSPRAAAALLRLALEKLVTKYLDAKGSNLNEKIGYLVKHDGLPPKIQQSLDAVRVIGNNAVHPGQIDLKDNKDMAIVLFRLLNIIVEKMITEPREIEEIYGILPESVKKSINERDGNG